MIKKIVNVIHTIFIAIWPISFLILIGEIQTTIQRRISMAFSPTYAYLLIPIYAVSAGLFVLAIFRGKEFQRRKTVFVAHIFAALSVTAFCAMWILSVGEHITLRFIISHTLVRVHVGVFSLLLGYVLSVAIWATILRMPKELDKADAIPPAFSSNKEEKLRKADAIPPAFPSNKEEESVQ